MSSNFQQFKALHQSGQLLIIPNAWDAKSAAGFQQANFPAVATSSAAVAGALGYEDGEKMPFSDYMFVIQRMLAVLQVPLSVDIEMGYGSTNEAIFNNIRQLAQLGVAGINIEDSTIGPNGRVLKDARVFAQTIAYIKQQLQEAHLSLFVNVRCDTFLLNVTDKQSETIDRLKIYESNGADGIFLPCISTPADIAVAISNTSLPLNVMCIPGLPDFNALRQLGVSRASMGPFLFSKAYEQAATLSRETLTANSFSPIL
ncbi:MAG: isocitrate lyase/phosphoenolpyruvate mutase family protein [Chitinophaga sp.]|uniref:isocitrate lyase/PEP mutase family protein n=1 Tax=Chitinophaga sp. TaxID=1869181 RepID=UPI001B11015B|nr:isocitrate lyase/phosphoenolpyruvate mutase family protein [Chitinophaga sp.]MBO9730298.1 isocitrate lyase/phosphoenolpyruvate mutase family protein [Chitinophaga sp.]